MDIGPSKRVGPDLQTAWGTYPSPYFNVPAQNTRVMQYLPPTIRGRHLYRNQPRPISNLAPDPVTFGPANIVQRHAPSLVPGDIISHGVGQEHQEETKLGLYLFLGAIGAVLLLSSGGSK